LLPLGRWPGLALNARIQGKLYANVIETIPWRQGMSGPNELDETDYDAWARQQIELLSKRRFSDLEQILSDQFFPGKGG
jgi:hypothetical protein